MRGICKIEGCTTTVDARGWCQKHYFRWKRNGTTKTRNNMKPVTWEYLLSCSIINKETGCIEWQKAISSGYGVCQYHGRTERTHRISYEINIGPIPEGMYVCHTCDNKTCINPDHLWIGTHADNIADFTSKGLWNQPRGEKSGMAKLTVDDVLFIKKNYDGTTWTGVSLGKKFGVNKVTIYSILSGKTWVHVGDANGT